VQHFSNFGSLKSTETPNPPKLEIFPSAISAISAR